MRSEHQDGTVHHPRRSSHSNWPASHQRPETYRLPSLRSRRWTRPPLRCLSATCPYGPPKPPSPGYPLQPQTLGEHLKKRRLDVGLRQKDLARRLETSLFNIWNWQRNVTGPSLRFLPRITSFLGYAPLDTSDLTLGQQILTYRRVRGLRQEDLARQLGVDPSTLASWERGSPEPMGKHRERLENPSRRQTLDSFRIPGLSPQMTQRTGQNQNSESHRFSYQSRCKVFFPHTR